MVLVDDIIHSFAFQINNGVPLLKWNNRKNDKELKYLYKYLAKCSQSHDVREYNKKHFNLEGLAEIPIEKIIKKTSV
jgi:TFIIF-interacting CTD phosphatase-like protein